MKEFLSGKKTYVVALVAILYAVVFIGLDLDATPSVPNWNEAFVYILAALGLGGLRAGVTKSGPQ